MDSSNVTPMLPSALARAWRPAYQLRSVRWHRRHNDLSFRQQKRARMKALRTANQPSALRAFLAQRGHDRKPRGARCAEQRGSHA